MTHSSAGLMQIVLKAISMNMTKKTLSNLSNGITKSIQFRMYLARQSIGIHHCILWKINYVRILLFRVECVQRWNV